MKMKYFAKFAVLLPALSFETGCQHPTGKFNRSCSSSEGSIDEAVEFTVCAEYFKEYRNRIEKGAEQGDITLAQDMLLTNRIQVECEKKFGPHFRSSGLVEYQLMAFYFSVAVNILPKIDRPDVIDLLCRYYFGEKPEVTTTLSESNVTSLVSQLINGTYVEPGHRKMRGTITIEKVQPTESTQTVMYRVIYKENNNNFIWLFGFRQFVTRAGPVWLPVKWGGGGYF